MSEENKYPTFNASDIERYHRGEMSSAEMHALEKAALDDPFLADAIEGYAGKRLNVQKEINILKDELNERLEGAKIVALPSKKSRKISWSSAAAILLLLFGAGYLLNQYAFNKKNSKVADLNTPRREEIRSADTNSTAYKMPDSAIVSDSSSIISNAGQGFIEPIKKDSIVNKLFSNPAIKTDGSKSPTPSDEMIVPANPSSVNSGSTNDAQTIKKLEQDYARQKSDNIEMKKPAIAPARDSNLALNYQYRASKDSRNTGDKKFVETQFGNAQNTQADNSFRGRITDPYNNPVPFANITATNERMQTYADAKGYFNLVSPDTVLDIAVRSVGFADNTVRLRNSIAYNKVILQDDSGINDATAAIVLNTRKANLTERANPGNFKVEEPEPADGWANYDAYMVNNLNVPDEIKDKKISGNVEISFDIDKRGDPVNLKVEKSLCDKCDEEAVRLIKAGPKWKRKAKKARTSVNVPFQ